VEASQVLTIQNIREGLAAAVECRRFWIWHGIKLSSFMAGGGALVLVAGYLTQGHVSAWGFLLPAALVAVVLPGAVKEVRHFSTMVKEFQAAEQLALTGSVVQAQDIPSLGRRAAA